MYIYSYVVTNLNLNLNLGCHLVEKKSLPRGGVGGGWQILLDVLFLLLSNTIVHRRDRHINDQSRPSFFHSNLTLFNFLLDGPRLVVVPLAIFLETQEL